jgi:hypothetical protein
VIWSAATCRRYESADMSAHSKMHCHPRRFSAIKRT